MLRSLLLIVLFALYQWATLAQSVQLSVSGHVRCHKEAVEGGIVALLQPSDSSMIAYAMTDKQGCYVVKTVTPLSELLIKVTGFGIHRQVKRINAQAQTVDFNVEKEDITLREAVVKSKKLWGSRDTLNYLVSAYARQHDRTIGDILRQLPGITIEDNGTIKYQGAPINHFYIENLDLLQGRYNLATEGIKAEDVFTVQVLENHEHVRALQDQTPTDRAAINLKLKDKAKGIWVKSGNVGTGVYGDRALWETMLQGMYFGRKRQHMLRYSGDNLGRNFDVAFSHYGLSMSNHAHLVGMVEHGRPPVGNSTFGYRHGINLNNLAKLSDSATVNYNFHYNHLLTRGSSYTETTYLLPDGTQLWLTEDVADRTHAHSANLQLTYEKNRQRRFSQHSLSLFGQWDEGRGNISSTHSNPTTPSRDDAATFVAQTLHYRSLGLTHRSHLVNRTARGGGFDWTSTNSLSSTPHALSIGGNMTARQDITLTELSSLNSAELLRQFHTRHWTLSTTAHLNATYTAVTSALAHPEKPIATQGDLHHWRINADVGPVARYAKGAFQTSLQLPLALSYTSLNNADVPGEMTDAHSLRFRLQPSFSLLWKATDNFTFTTNANYSTSETSWPQLFTASMMKNYRQLTRYRAALHDNHGIGARFNMAFKDLFNGLFAHIEGSSRHAWSNIAYGTTIDGQAHSVIQAAYQPNRSHRYSLTAYGRKDFDWHTTQLEISATGAKGASEMLRQSTLVTYRTTDYSLHAALAFDVFKGLRVDYNATWLRHRAVSEHHTQTSTELKQRVQCTVQLLPSRLFLHLQCNHSYNNSVLSTQKNFLFLSSSLQYKASKQVELTLSGDNLTNIRHFFSHSFGDMEEHSAIYHLRPRSILLTARIQL